MLYCVGSASLGGHLTDIQSGALLATLSLHNTTRCHIAKLLQEYQAVTIFINVILARNRQLADDDRMIETCRNIFKKVLILVK